MDRGSSSRALRRSIQDKVRVLTGAAWNAATAIRLGIVCEWADFAGYRQYLLLRPSGLVVLAITVVVVSQCYGWVIAKAESVDRSAAIITGVALAGWLIGSAVNLHSRIKQHTFDVIYRARFDVGYREQVLELIAQCPGDVVEAADIDRAMRFASERGDNASPDPDCKLYMALTVVSNFIEALALSVRTCEADERILRCFYESIIKRNAQRLQHLFLHYRRQPGHENAFEHIIWLVCRWGGDLPIVKSAEDIGD